LSLPPNALDDDSFHEQPPRLSYALDDDEDEIEQRRRAALGRDRQSLTSFIDPSFIDLNEYEPGEYEDVTEQRRQILDGDMSIHVDGVDDDGETAELRAMLEARRQSGEGGDLTEITDGEPTFLFRIPERSRLSLAPPVPRTPEGQTADDDDDEAQGYDDVEEDLEEDTAQAGAEVEFDDDDENVPFETAGLDDEMEHDVPLRETSIPLPDDEVRADAAASTKTKAPYKRLPKEVKISHFGIEYPSFPMPVIKKLASTFSRQYGGSGKLSKETLVALQQASDWYFEQVSEDLADYATHAGRKTIEEADMVTLMKRYDPSSYCTSLHKSTYANI
jgi:histone H3/H4